MPRIQHVINLFFIVGSRCRKIHDLGRLDRFKKYGH